MPTQEQYNTSTQTLRDIDCKIAVLDYDYTVLDEISGRVTTLTLNNTADSDVRRTADINMVLKDSILNTNSNKFYWTVGNPYWFDKYLQIYVGIKDIKSGEYIWVNEGVYCINAPTISYDATSNSLAFQAVDLVSKMTGMRNGQLDGMTYTIEVGSSIKGAIESILIEQGFTKYILYDPPQATVPQDINIEAGGYAWDLLTQLRDINANWEMFFDIDGVFHFQQIPSGKVSSGTDTGNVEPVPLVNDTMLKKLYISYELNNNFEEVKNCVEVLGKTHEPNEICTAVIAGDTITLTTSQVANYYLNNSWVMSFGIQVTEGSTEPTLLSESIKTIQLNDVDNNAITTITLRPFEYINTGNQYYCINVEIGETISDITAEYLGYLQPHAIAIENNPDSPFYIGTSTRYNALTGNPVDFASEKSAYITELTGTVQNNTLIMNLSPWCTASDFNTAPVGYQWQFKVNVPSVVQPITTLGFTCGGKTGTTFVYNLSGEQITLDYAQPYLVIAYKYNTNTLRFVVAYYPIEAKNMPMSTTSIINRPRFDAEVRYVCVGDEYDNIYSNDLAEQRARYEIYLRSRLHDSITITTVPIYWLDVNNIIEFNVDGDSEESDLWMIKSIDTDFSTSGTQTINAIRYYPLYADISLENLATQE